MIPSDMTLFTWVDVEDVFLRQQNAGNWPEWLKWVRAFWDGVSLGVEPSEIGQAVEWLERTFGPRFVESDGNHYLLLEGPAKEQRLLGVLLEPSEEQPQHSRFQPTLARPVTMWPMLPEKSRSFPPSLEHQHGFPSVVAFHSFKGGVGRTLHAIAFVEALAENTGKAVLLIDADLEAPGISWMLEKRRPVPPISFSDFLALAHSDESSDFRQTIGICAHHLQDALTEGVYVLPAFRSYEQFLSLEVRPEHLFKGADDPYILTTLLGRLGRELGVSAVVVDLRAGLSELATGLILDPRVHRVFVTTLSSQSVEGTCKLLELLAERSPSTREDDPLPSVVISQLPAELGEYHLAAQTRLGEAAERFVKDEFEEDAASRLPQIVESTFQHSLLLLPRDWEEVVRIIRRTKLTEVLSPLVAWVGIEKPRAGVDIPDPAELRSKRKELEKLAENLEYAEKAQAREFLTTEPLRRLTEDHRNRVPIAVIVGAKGAGKTFTFLQLIRSQTWDSFSREAGVASQFEAQFCPSLESVNLEDQAAEMLTKARNLIAEQLGFPQPPASVSLKDQVRNWLQMDLHEGKWRENWLDLIAWSMGFRPHEEGAGREITGELMSQEKRIVILVDGLEELFTNISEKTAEQCALRALLQGVPEWLMQQVGRPLGIIVFVRRDLVLYSIPQNTAQFLARYEPYALKWSREEALRLVAWVASKANIPLVLDTQGLHTASEEDVTDALISVWGTKLGQPNSKEARSAEWVMYALSDLRLQIQARDVVRFLRLAATHSMSDAFWTDRVLVPSGIRKALSACSTQKINEIQQENKPLEGVFAKLRKVDSAHKQIPFTVEESGLDSRDIKILEENGAMLREGEDCYMPEIFRLGLGFTLKHGKRPRVLALARRAALRE